MSDTASVSPPTVRGAHATSLSTLSLAGFVALGLPDGMWGTAWPTLRQTFHQPVGALGLILVAVTLGALATSLGTAPALQHFGAGRVLTAAGVVGGGAAVLLFAAPQWWWIVGAAVLVGACAGVVDTVLNAVMAMSGSTRMLNILHGAYGVGTALGPVVVTVALLSGSWRPAYLLLLGAELALALGWWRTRGRWRGETSTRTPAGVEPESGGPEAGDPEGGKPERGEPVHGAHFEQRPRRWIVFLGTWMFFCCTGFEVTAGQWAATYLRGPMAMSAAEAGIVVFLYWGSLAASRFAVAIPRRALDPVMLVRTGCLAGLVGAVLVWWHPSHAVLILGFVLIGASLAPVYPALVALTPRRVGRKHAHRVIGWQVAAAGSGGAAVSALAGLVIDRAGLGALGPYLVASGVTVLFAALALERATRHGAGRPSPGPRAGALDAAELR